MIGCGFLLLWFDRFAVFDSMVLHVQDEIFNREVMPSSQLFEIDSTCVKR